MSVSAQNVVKRFGDFTALNGVSLDARDGEFLALLGPSGSGKTTLLRVMAGLEFPDSGSVAIAGEDMAGTGARDRRVGFVFQHYALFRHMSVADNIGFGLTVRPRANRPAAAEIARRVTELLDLVQLSHLGKRYPAQLSGGQRQRVALARALINQPQVLLLDEPLGALDLKLREQMQTELKALQRQLGITFLFITHDQHEALSMSDRIGVFNLGKLEQVGTPHEVYNTPRTRFVAQFVGAANLLDGEAARTLTGHRSAMLRPERIRTGAASGARAQGPVTEAQYFGAFTRIKVRLGDGFSGNGGAGAALLQADLPDAPGARPPAVGDTVHLHWDDRAVHALADGSS